MRIEHDIGAGKDDVGRQCEHHATGAGVASNATDHQLPGRQQFCADIVDCLNIRPGFGARILRGLNHVQMHAVGKTAAPPLDQQHLGITGFGPAQRGDHALALLGAHGAVVELEGQLTDDAGFPVADRLIGFVTERVRGDRPVQHRHLGQLPGQHVPRRLLEGLLARLRFAP
ncbi:hypothetical protein D3C81_1542890 [compost metagenome]